jgi:hypothetical protein
MIMPRNGIRPVIRHLGIEPFVQAEMTFGLRGRLFRDRALGLDRQ